MKFYDSLYLSESIEKPNRAKRRLFFGVGCSGLYVISLARNTDQLDIFSAALLKQKYFDKIVLKNKG